MCVCEGEGGRMRVSVYQSPRRTVVCIYVTVLFHKNRACRLHMGPVFNHVVNPFRLIALWVVISFFFFNMNTLLYVTRLFNANLMSY